MFLDPIGLHIIRGMFDGQRDTVGFCVTIIRVGLVWRHHLQEDLNEVGDVVWRGNQKGRLVVEKLPYFLNIKVLDSQPSYLGR